MAKDIDGILAVGDSRDIVHSHTASLGHEEPVCRSVVQSIAGGGQTGLRGTGSKAGEVCLPDHVHGIFAVGNASNIENFHAVSRCLHHKETISGIVKCKARRSGQPRLRLPRRAAVIIGLPQLIIRQTVEEEVITIQVVDEHSVIRCIGHKQAVVCGIKRKADARGTHSPPAHTIMPCRFGKNRFGRRKRVRILPKQIVCIDIIVISGGKIVDDYTV